MSISASEEKKETDDWHTIQNSINCMFIKIPGNFHDYYEEEDTTKYRKVSLLFSSRLFGPPLEASLVKRTGGYKQSRKGMLSESIYNQESPFLNNVDIRANKFMMRMMEYIDRAQRVEGKTPLTSNIGRQSR